MAHGHIAYPVDLRSAGDKGIILSTAASNQPDSTLLMRWMLDPRESERAQFTAFSHVLLSFPSVSSISSSGGRESDAIPPHDLLH